MTPQLEFYKFLGITAPGVSLCRYCYRRCEFWTRHVCGEEIFAFVLIYSCMCWSGACSIVQQVLGAFFGANGHFGQRIITKGLVASPVTNDIVRIINKDFTVSELFPHFGVPGILEGGFCFQYCMYMHVISCAELNGLHMYEFFDGFLNVDNAAVLGTTRVQNQSCNMKFAWGCRAGAKTRVS